MQKEWELYEVGLKFMKPISVAILRLHCAGERGRCFLYLACASILFIRYV